MKTQTIHAKKAQTDRQAITLIAITLTVVAILTLAAILFNNTPAIYNLF